MKLGFIGLSGHMNTYIVLYLNGIKFVASYVVFFFFCYEIILNFATV